MDLLRSYYKLQIRKDTDNLKRLFGGKKVFSFPKPLSFVTDLIKACTGEGDIIMDFFAGSSTTAHATILSSNEESKQRNFILVQLPEDLEDNLERATSNREKKVLRDAIDYCVLKHYPPKLTEIGKERIRLARKEIGSDSVSHRQMKLDDQPALDFGFRVFKLDSSNIKKWSGQSENLQKTLSSFADNLTSDDSRTHLDIIFELILKLGLPLSTCVSEYSINGSQIYSISSGALMIYLDDVASIDIAEKMTELHKELGSDIWTVVFKDNGFCSDSMKANVKETLKAAGLQEDSFLTL